MPRAKARPTGSSHPEDTAGITTRAHQETNVQADSHGTTGAMSVSVACSPQDCSTASTSATQNVVTVTASEPFTFLTPIVSNIVSSVNLRSSASSVAIGQAGVAVTPAPCVNVPDRQRAGRADGGEQRDHRRGSGPECDG